jgi:pyridoxamine 5'-phosphate oxidase
MPPLERSALADDPIEQFRDWYERAAGDVPLADAMALATVDADGSADARMVLLKGFGPDGFRFFTNLESAKARKLPSADDDEYLSTRPDAARIGAWASPQSETLPDRAALDDRVRDVTERFAGADVPRPDYWGGYLLRPERIEFWQGQAARLHDRFVYLREGDGWSIRRLAP